MSRRSPRGSVTTSPPSGSRPRATRARSRPRCAQIADAAHAVGAVLVVGTDPIGYGVLTPPAEQGADIVCGDIQSLGLHQWFGGAHGGFIAVHDDPSFIMEMPSRLFGLATTDVPGRVRIRRRRLRPHLLRASRGGQGVGRHGRRPLGHRRRRLPRAHGSAGHAPTSARLLLARTRYAQLRLAAIPGVVLGDAALHLREFTIDVAGAGLTAHRRRRGAPHARASSPACRSASTACSSASPR